MGIKIITFNIRYDKPDPGNYRWEVRKNAVASLIYEYTPDIIGTQEVKVNQLLDLQQLLPNYYSLGGDRRGTGNDEHCAIFYQKDRLNCLDHGDFWLSETQDVPGSITSSWGNHLPRIASWARFNIFEDNRQIVIINTHLDYDSKKARELGAKLIFDSLQTEKLNPDKESFIFVTADFNDQPGSNARNTFLNPLKNGLCLLDVLSDLKLSKQMTYNDFTDKAFLAIDTIYYDSRLNLHSVKVENKKYDGILPSDHFPVVAEFD
ncbi:MAG: endonuclease/exonuclease/phosphatase family protein [Okeania sp. SIO3H1]|uniref:endonuclease/exonuclease/phosphatase family protein n=1 Tax=Okeania sp. SIO1I7 TaxID=2607772 RepID=UPI0013C9184B|nr:endonuclease/exonuclease/phosphatase family protein [Okeania sp. SIO1I7]NEN90438.1 endonuclease/exonuclease/phosphatase family protein [Okeania sp. SIO3H1]NET29840.1 endonuclease/exonuclease/phosphatase family protein [Okeania sp. SIO1I7]